MASRRSLRARDRCHVKNVRRKIEPDPHNPRYLLTVFGVGYVRGRAAMSPSGWRGRAGARQDGVAADSRPGGPRANPGHRLEDHPGAGWDALPVADCRLCAAAFLLIAVVLRLASYSPAPPWCDRAPHGVRFLAIAALVVLVLVLLRASRVFNGCRQPGRDRRRRRADRGRVKRCRLRSVDRASYGRWLAPSTP